MKKKTSLLIIFLGLSITIFGQKSVNISNRKHKETFRFKLINNLIILPISVNGIPLNFILDSGSGSTLLLDNTTIDSAKLRNKDFFYIKGLGENNDRIKAIKSSNNNLQLRSINLDNITIYIPLELEGNFSSTFNIPIHGMIGYDLLQHFIVKINYSKHKITFYDKNYFQTIRHKRYQELALELIQEKPYITIKYLKNNKSKSLKMLIDSGGGDSFWLFENTNLGITIPTKNISDFLGRGLNGDINGKRAKMELFKMSKYIIDKPLVSFPDSTALNIKKYKKIGRNGSIGARILKRFNIIFDYPNKMFYFKKNNTFKEPFYYNMSGISTGYSGERSIIDKVENIKNELSNDESGTESVFSVTIEKVIIFKKVNKYIVNNIRKNSVADKAGIEVYDEILFINDNPVYNYTIDELNHFFFSPKEKKVKLTIDRNGQILYFNLVLKDEL